MYEPPLTTSDPRPVPRRVRGFWFWSIWVSIGGFIGVPVVAITIAIIALGRIAENMERDAGSLSAGVDELHHTAMVVLLLQGFALVTAALMLVWMIVSIVKFARQPKVEW
ncbi:MAG: hypothetical protein EOP85_06525 [Verrucomicrobiaceae bacterium]|nr:MAG: hypothetical protein EOP85_06525 [Verrucomicrobiaceae bacterium]